MKNRRTARGTILIVAIGLIAALAIVGATMINVSRVDRLAARNFRQIQEMDMAKSSVIEYLQQKLAWDYWSRLNHLEKKMQENAWTAGQIDDAQLRDEPTAGSLLALIRPNLLGRVVTTTDRTAPGLFKTSGGSPGAAGQWHSYPIMPRLPDPGRTDTTYGNVPDSTPLPAPMVLPASGGRTITVAVLMVDLSGRYNLNIHGSSRMSARGGQASINDGTEWSQLTPFWIDADATINLRRPIHPSDNFPAFVTGASTSGGNLGRYGSNRAPTTGDHSVHYFVPGAQNLIYGSDELMELLNLWGTPGMTRLENSLPQTLHHNSAGIDPGEAMSRKALFTTFSAVSGTRPRDRIGMGAVEPEPVGKLCIQADLDRAPLSEILAAMRAANGVFATAHPTRSLTTRELLQIAANLEGFRNSSHQPQRIQFSDAGGTVNIYGVNAQPFINEVYVERIGEATTEEEERIFRVHVELVNPYEVPLSRGSTHSYSKLEMGNIDGAVTQFTLPASIAASTKGSFIPQGVVVTQTITVPAGKSAMDYLQPVQLWAFSRSAPNDLGGPTNTEIVIDRYRQVTLQPGQSMQRKTIQAMDRSGVSRQYFNGWAANQSVGPESCSGGYIANEAGSAPARPIENRSLGTGPGESEARNAVGPLEPDVMAFRRLGDIGRLLRFGHDGPSIASSKTATEKLAEVSASGDGYVDLTVAKYARLLTTLAVNHPYYDRFDNDGDGFVDADDTGTNRNDILGPEIYRHGMINLNTAPPEVIRGMVSLQVERHGRSAWSAAMAIANNAGSIRNPADILKYDNHQSIFISDGRDDDHNGAPDDHAERTWLYGYMSNWATVRSDTFAVYGTIRIATSAGRTEGVRRFIAVLDRVPATAYPPFLDQEATGDQKPTPNPRFLPVRLANFMWLE